MEPEKRSDDDMPDRFRQAFDDYSQRAEDKYRSDIEPTWKGKLTSMQRVLIVIAVVVVIALIVGWMVGGDGLVYPPGE